MSALLTLSAQVEGLSTRKDGTLKLVLGTQELNPQDAAQLFALQNQLVNVGIKAGDIGAQEIDQLRSSKFEIDDIPEGKSPSQRLRNVLYVLWSKGDTGYDDFNLYYLSKMDLMIIHYRSKIDQ